MSKKKHSKVKVRGKAAKSLSAIGDFIWRLKTLRQKVAIMENSEVVVGWADEAKEQKRAKPKAVALAINKSNERKGRRNREIVSNFDADFVGPGIKAASLATIAKVMRYGRAGGVNEKTGHEYGAIPARDFVKVLHEKHTKPIVAELRKSVEKSIKKDSPPDTAQVTLSRIGVMCKGQLQRAMMDSNAYAPNAPITIEGGWMANPKNKKPFHVEGKGSSRPLWNKGTLIKSVDFEIRGRK